MHRNYMHTRSAPPDRIPVFNIESKPDNNALSVTPPSTPTTARTLVAGTQWTKDENEMLFETLSGRTLP